MKKKNIFCLHWQSSADLLLIIAIHEFEIVSQLPGRCRHLYVNLSDRYGSKTANDNNDFLLYQ